jgi:hypothetical protein
LKTSILKGLIGKAYEKYHVSDPVVDRRRALTSTKSLLEK